MCVYIIYIVSTAELEQITNIQEDISQPFDSDSNDVCFLYIEQFEIFESPFQSPFVFSKLTFIFTQKSNTSRPRVHSNSTKYHISFISYRFSTRHLRQVIRCWRLSTKRMEAARCAKKNMPRGRAPWTTPGRPPAFNDWDQKTTDGR